MDKKEFQKKLLATFQQEAADHVQALSAGLIELEKAADAATQAALVETVFREAHSLKGAARAVGFTDIESVCQAVESVFAALKRGELKSSQALFDTLHHAVDTLGRLTLAGAVSNPDAAMIASLLQRLNGVLRGGPRTTMEPAPAPAGESPPVWQEPRRPGVEERHWFSDTVRISTAQLDALLFQAEGLVSAKLTAMQRLEDIRAARRALLEHRKRQAGIAPLIAAAQHGLRTPLHPGQPKLDAQLRKMLESLQSEDAFLKSFEARIAALEKSAAQDQRTVGSMVDGLLDGMKNALMLPIASLLDMFPKLVRDLSRDQGKDVDLSISGGEIEIDRRILDQMRDPLIHLVRNAVDHGMEDPAERIRRGKSRCGSLTVAISHKEGHWIEICVADDGRGINAESVAEAAGRLGMQGDDGARNALALIFESGVSTSAMVTDISGRGLGLAIVRDKVERLGGGIAVESTPGSGASFRITLPLTLATFRGVHVRVGGQRFVLPTMHVEQAIRIPANQVKTVSNRETLQWNGEALALVPLASVLEIAPGRDKSGAAASRLSVLVLAAASERIAFRVDEVLDEQEVLVKPLGRQLPRVRNIAGATVLGSGKTVPILDVPDLLKSARRIAATPPAMRMEAETSMAARKRIVVAEDSITSRMLLKNILESAGYQVLTAIDGIDALTLLRTEVCDLLVSDIDMPRMNGFELTAKVRADKSLAELPVVLVTSLASREHRERGAEVGANAYIVKGSFDQSNLLDVIRRLL